jgi:predicted DNA-binding transcriptional regulator YafY
MKKEKSKGSKKDRLQVMVRQWDMLRLLAEYDEGVTAKELLERMKEEYSHNVDIRTVERDLNILQRVFGLDHDGEEKPKRGVRPPRRWRVVDPVEFSSISLSDAISLSMVREVLQVLPESMMGQLQRKFAMAEGKLEAIQDNLHVRRMQKVRYLPATLGLIPPKIPVDILKGVQQALFEEKQIAVLYSKINDKKPKELTLHPLSLVLRGSVPYLVATAFDYESPLMYALHRISRVKITDSKIKIPDGYSLDRYIQEGAFDFSIGGEIQLKLRVENGLASYLAETPIAANQKIGSDGHGWILTATLRNSWQLHFWILSQGSKVTVLEPDFLREGIRGELESAAASYAVPVPTQESKKTKPAKSAKPTKPTQKTKPAKKSR